jgi:carboxyl-terminal processing protease
MMGMALLVATTIFAQQSTTPKASHETTSKLVCKMIGKYHIGHPEIDDAVAGRLFKRYLSQLDSQKLYFTRADIDEFKQHETMLDDQVKLGKIDFAYHAFDTYLMRLEERIKLAHTLIDAEHDFTISEEMVVDDDNVDWAQTDDEINERWRKRIKFDLLSLKLEDTPLEEARTQLHKRYRNVLHTMRQTDDGETLEMYLSSLAHCFDPHSSYMSPERLEDFRISMELSLEGIGAALRSEYGMTVVDQIVPGGAADKDGRLKAGDKIVGVGQETGEIDDVVEMKLNRVVRRIRGRKGTIVRLQVKPADNTEVAVYELTRQKVELKSAEVKGEIINTADRLKGTGYRIGVINIPSFYRDFRGAQQGIENFRSTARDVRRVLQSFYDDGGIEALVVDLRSNGGGALSEAIDVSGLFLKEGPIVQVKEKGARIKPHKDEDPEVSYTGPLVILCNRLSASASEIFAGAIKDYGRGIIVGDTTTHGKGTVQNVMPVSEQGLFQYFTSQRRGALKLTINQFYRVNGDSTQTRGVKSQVTLPSLMDHMELGEGFLDNAMKFDQVPPAKYDPLGFVSAELASKLREASRQRVAADPDFKKVKDGIERYLARKNRATISLNEEVLRKERDIDKKKDEDTSKEDSEEASEEESEEKEVPDKPDRRGEGPIFPDNFYNDEVLQITVDYLEALRGLNTASR